MSGDQDDEIAPASLQPDRGEGEVREGGRSDRRGEVGKRERKGAREIERGRREGEREGERERERERGRERGREREEREEGVQRRSEGKMEEGERGSENFGPKVGSIHTYTLDVMFWRICQSQWW